jgi:hypothetical protein
VNAEIQFTVMKDFDSAVSSERGVWRQNAFYHYIVANVMKYALASMRACRNLVFWKGLDNNSCIVLKFNFQQQGKEPSTRVERKSLSINTTVPHRGT